MDPGPWYLAGNDEYHCQEGEGLAQVEPQLVKEMSLWNGPESLVFDNFRCDQRP